MSDGNKLTVQVRTEFGKGFARRLRAAGQIPAVLYGHGTEVKHLALPGHQTGLIVRHANAVIDLDIDGESQLALVKDVQRDPVRQIIEHIDLVVVTRGEKMTVDVPYVTEGESFPGTIATLSATAITVEAEAMHIPEHIVVNIDGLEDGQHVYAKDLTLPAGVTLADDPELLVVGISTPSVSAEDEDAEPAEDGAESAE
ncbi:50S ribosomal protein L25/general stress protein Ctc [Microbacterium excoecariae]|uniref:50S ribosomal protein L25/general stress protein Ctc n=1 Tax=Microbacterium excoecariae TaxID=2715210 RepID=UPI00140C1E98|nr:50S ribosomal protein L25/general stress protein Ctc [Microbacterium excoecariae]NHI17362.1 50S ribosomal protein L25/general stress protein Ctc [Microbacterium excoecariae]